MEAEVTRDRINMAAWCGRSARNGYGTASDSTDPGELSAFAWVAEQVRGRTILDVGVGGGRTVSLIYCSRSIL
jgi:hypothetical protein